MALALAIAVAGIASTPGLAAPPREAPVTERDMPVGRAFADLVRAIQSALTELGVYGGAADGRLDRPTQDAIRLYQQRVGLPVDGEPTRDLLERLRFTEEVKRLTTRLQEVRDNQIAEARRALGSQSATRRLLAGRADEVADPTRDASACFAQPTVTCLLDEAVESTKAVARTQFRDWLYGEILAAQARAGFGAEALETLRLIDDPRLIIAGLRNIAREQAQSDQLAEAWETAAVIPPSWSRAEALSAVAPALAEAGEPARARDAVDRILALADEAADVRRRVATLSTLAVALADAAAPPALSERVLDRARALAEAPDKSERRGALRSEIATALADLGRVDESARMRTTILDPAHLAPVLMATTRAELRRGNIPLALAAAQSVSEQRYRVVALSRVAVAQAGANDSASSHATLDAALAATAEIDSRAAYARDYATSLVANAEIAIGAHERALTAARRIVDPRLRADTLWRLAAADERAGDADLSRARRAMAEAALAEVQSPLDRAWIMANLTVSESEAGDPVAAERALRRALDTAGEITSPWARAQAIVKVAASLIALRRGETVGTQMDTAR